MISERPKLSETPFNLNYSIISGFSSNYKQINSQSNALFIIFFQAIAHPLSDQLP